MEVSPCLDNNVADEIDNEDSSKVLRENVVFLPAVILTTKETGTVIAAE